MSIRKRAENQFADSNVVNLNKEENERLIHHEEDRHEPSNLDGDRMNIAVLFFLYLLQGIPIGLTAAIPMLLQNRGASYKQQAEFSFAVWPFSLKLLWAPIVDSLYSNKIGRRKSWLIPTQYLIGVFMLILSSHVEMWLGSEHESSNIQILTMIFFALNFLAATQDIAVDGWALTMLKRCNVGHASTCNSVGQTAGYFLGYVAFVALESKDFCNTYLRRVPAGEGLVTLPGFLWFWGICFLVTTTLVGILKREHGEPSEHRFTDHPDLDIKQTYKLLLDIVKLRPVQILSVILLTVKVTFSACDAVTSLKLIDAGVPKEKLALLAVPLIPLQIILPLAISKYTAGPRPMDIYIRAIPYRIVFALIATFIVFLTPMMSSAGNIPAFYYVLLIVAYGFYQVFVYGMFVAVMAFFAKISDPGVGATYMTLLNTVCNLGGNWPNTIVLWLVEILTWSECRKALPDVAVGNTCANKVEKEECVEAGGECHTIVDGYYLECILCALYGVVWIYFGRRQIQYLQSLPVRAWHVLKPGSSSGKSR